MKTVEEQREEIKTVKVENELQREEINAIKAENKELRCLHANIATNQTPFYSKGENRTQKKHSAFESRTSYCDLVNVDMQEIENSQGLTEDLSNNIACEITSSATVPTNHAGESNVVVVINTKEQPSSSNAMRKNEDQPTSKTPSNEKLRATKSVQGNNNSKQGARQQKPTYAEAVEHQPASSSMSKRSEAWNKKATDESKTEPASYEFIGVERRRNKIKSFFLAGIAENVTESQVFSYLKKRNVTPTHVRIFQSRRKGTLSAKINIPSKDCPIVSEENFWPKFVKCKPRKSNSAPSRKPQSTRAGNYSTQV
jgi:hypothetical protein